MILFSLYSYSYELYGQNSHRQNTFFLALLSLFISLYLSYSSCCLYFFSSSFYFVILISSIFSHLFSILFYSFAPSFFILSLYLPPFSSLYSIFSFFLIFFNFSIYSFIFCMTFLFFITCCISSITFLFLLNASNRINSITLGLKSSPLYISIIIV